MVKKKTEATTTKKTKVFDVAKPGDTPADPTARPVIVGHTSMIKQDPMVVENEEPSESLKATPQEMRMEPIETDADAADAAETDESQTEQKPTETVKQPEEIEASESSESDIDEETNIEEIAQDKVLKQAQQQSQRDQQIEKIINSRTYYVHTKTPPGKRTARSILILILLIAIAGSVYYFGFGAGRSMIGI